jgi:hypothetical protein
MKRNLLLQAAILLLSGCVSITLAQAGGSGGGAGGHGGGQSSGAPGNATTGNAGAGGANTNAAAPDSNQPGGVQGTPSQKTDATGTHPVGTPQSDVDNGGKGHARTMKGCIVKEETDYFLVPEKGNGRRIKLQAGNTDLSQHVNHEVKVHGSMERGNNASTVGASGTMGNTAGSTSTGTSAENGNSRRGGNRMMVVDKVDMVSETCPANTGTGGGTGTGSSTTPPPQF